MESYDTNPRHRGTRFLSQLFFRSTVPSVVQGEYRISCTRCFCHTRYNTCTSTSYILYVLLIQESNAAGWYRHQILGHTKWLVSLTPCVFRALQGAAGCSILHRESRMHPPISHHPYPTTLYLLHQLLSLHRCMTIYTAVRLDSGARV